jgi:hypothetical protein
MPLPNDPVGAGADMSQWQNWLMSMLQAQPVPPQPNGGPTAAADAATAPTGGAYSHMPFPGQRDPQGFWGARPGAVAPPQSSAAPGSASAAPIPGSPAARGPNLGYYRPMTGNARQAQWVGPNDPGNAFRGPLAAPPATQTIPPTATASVAPTPYGPNSPRLNPSGNLALTGGNQPNPNTWASVPVPTPPVRPTGWPFNQ